MNRRKFLSGVAGTGLLGGFSGINSADSLERDKELSEPDVWRGVAFYRSPHTKGRCNIPAGTVVCVDGYKYRLKHSKTMGKTKQTTYGTLVPAGEPRGPAESNIEGVLPHPPAGVSRAEVASGEYERGVQ